MNFPVIFIIFYKRYCITLISELSGSGNGKVLLREFELCDWKWVSGDFFLPSFCSEVVYYSDNMNVWLSEWEEERGMGMQKGFYDGFPYKRSHHITSHRIMLVILSFFQVSSANYFHHHCHSHPTWNNDEEDDEDRHHHHDHNRHHSLSLVFSPPTPLLGINSRVKWSEVKWKT